MTIPQRQDDTYMAWMRKRIWLTPYTLQGLVEATAVLGGVITNGSIPVAITTAGISGWLMGDGEFQTGGIPIPHDLDPAYEIGFKIHWTANANGACTADWIMQYKIIAEGVLFAIPATALDTAIVAADSHGSTDWFHAVTSRGVLDGNTITKAQIDGEAMLMLEVEMDGADNETAIYLLGISMDYAVQRCTGSGAGISQSLTDNV